MDLIGVCCPKPGWQVCAPYDLSNSCTIPKRFRVWGRGPAGSSICLAFLIEAWGSDEIMDVKVRGLLPFLASSNISVPPL